MYSSSLWTTTKIYFAQLFRTSDVQKCNRKFQIFSQIQQLSSPNDFQMPSFDFYL